jgi:energy-coupling factor transporter transmembrane protein EcfT
MRQIFHHLAALGSFWVSLFVALPLVALACAIVAVVARERRRVLWALVLSGSAAFGSLALTFAVAAAGIAAANSADTISADPSQKSRELAEGISVAMNGAALGMASTLFAGLAAVVCLVAFLVRRSGLSLSARNRAHVVERM